MKEQEQFDHLVKGKLEGRSFEPSEGGWAAAEQLIAAQENRLLWRKRLFVAAAVLLAAAGGLTAWLSNSSGEQHPVAQTSPVGQASAGAEQGGSPAVQGNDNEANPNSQNPNSQNPNSQNPNSQNNNSQNPNSQNNNSQNNNQANSNSQNNNQANPNSQNNKQSNLNSQNNKQSNSNSQNKNQANSNNGSGHTSKGSGSKGNQGGGNKQDQGQSSTNANKGNGQQVGASKGTGQKDTNGQAAATANGTGEDGAQAAVGATQQGKGETSQKGNDPANPGGITIDDSQGQADMSGSMKNTRKETDPAAEAKTDPQSGAGGASLDAEAVKEKEATKTAGNLLADFSATKTMDALDQEDKAKSGKASRNINPSNGYWFARGGVSYMPGFESTGTSGRSLNPVLGGGYSLGFGGRYRIEASLQYTTIAHAADSSRIYSSINYSFGSDLSRTEIGLSRLHYAALPIHLRIGVNTNNAFLIGAEPHYLFAAESKVRTYTQHGNSILDDKTKTVFGYQQGLRTFDMLMSAGYVRTINNHWEAMLLFNYGVLDVKDNMYFTFDKFERHKNLQVMLHYTF